MGQVKINGALIAGPPQGGDVFPAALMNVPLRLRTTPKGFGAATGILHRTIMAGGPAEYVTLADIGVGSTVERATLLYLKSSGPLDVRLTCDDGLGGDVVSEFQQDGLSLVEFTDLKHLKKVDLRGSAQIEFFACGR